MATIRAYVRENGVEYSKEIKNPVAKLIFIILVLLVAIPITAIVFVAFTTLIIPIVALVAIWRLFDKLRGRAW